MVGRTEGFHFSIGHMTYAVCEMLARNFSICVLPTEPHRRALDEVVLPNGRRIPICKDIRGVEVSIFCDILSECIRRKLFLGTS